MSFFKKRKSKVHSMPGVSSGDSLENTVESGSHVGEGLIREVLEEAWGQEREQQRSDPASPTTRPKGLIKILQTAPQRVPAGVFLAPGVTEPLISSQRYELVEEVGRGQWGVVYKAVDHIHPGEHKVVAIKIPYLSPLAKEQLRSRRLSLNDVLEKEAGTGHGGSNVVNRYLDIDSNGQLFIVMPYIEEFLSDRLRFLDQERVREEQQRDASTKASRSKKKPLKKGMGHLRIIPIADTAVKYTLDILNGLQEGSRIFGGPHCDLKPDNIAIDKNGDCSIADWGTSTFASLHSRSENPRDNMGCLYVRSPRLFLEGQHPETRSDLFAVGSLFYRMLTGEYIFERELKEAEEKESLEGLFFSRATVGESEEGLLAIEDLEGIMRGKLRDPRIPKRHQRFLLDCLTADLEMEDDDIHHRAYRDRRSISDTIETLEGIEEKQRKRKSLRMRTPQIIAATASAAGSLGLLVGTLGGARLATNSFHPANLTEQEIEMLQKDSEYEKARGGSFIEQIRAIERDRKQIFEMQKKEKEAQERLMHEE